MSSRAGVLSNAPPQWDARGPYWMTTDGQKSYLPPATAAQYGRAGGDPRFAQYAEAMGEAPASSFTRSSGTWNGQTAGWDQGVNMSGIGGAALGGAALAAPFVIPTVAGALGFGAPASAAFDTAPAWGAGGFTNAAAIGKAGTTVATAAQSAVPWGSLINAGSNLFGNLFGAHQQNSANDRSAAIQAQSAREQLQFLRDQAQNGFANDEAARRGNYDQWAARERRLGSVAQALGYGPRPVAAYVPGVDPHFASTPNPYSVAGVLGR